MLPRRNRLTIASRMIAPTSETRNEVDVERRLVDVAAVEDQPADERADDADDDVEQYALLRVGAHDEAGQPADDAADHEPD